MSKHLDIKPGDRIKVVDKEANPVLYYRLGTLITCEDSKKDLWRIEMDEPFLGHVKTTHLFGYRFEVIRKKENSLLIFLKS